MKGMSDDGLLARIDTELQNALDVAPSPAFLARVRARVARRAEERAAAPGFSVGPGLTFVLRSLRWLAPAAVALGALLMVMTLQFRGGAPVVSVTVPPPPDVHAPAISATPAPGTGARHPSPFRHPTPSRHPAPDRTRHQTPGMTHPAIPHAEVLVPPGDAIALEQFVAGLRAKQVDPSALFPEESEAGALKAIAIAPIEIRLLTPER